MQVSRFNLTIICLSCAKDQFGTEDFLGGKWAPGHLPYLFQDHLSIHVHGQAAEM